MKQRHFYHLFCNLLCFFSVHHKQHYLRSVVQLRFFFKLNCFFFQHHKKTNEFYQFRKNLSLPYSVFSRHFPYFTAESKDFKISFEQSRACNGRKLSIKWMFGTKMSSTRDSWHLCHLKIGYLKIALQ